jgi:hypothetical protein
VLKEYRLGAFSSRGCGLFPAADGCISLLAEPRRTDALIARGAARADGLARARPIADAQSAGGHAQEWRGEALLARGQGQEWAHRARGNPAARRKAFAKLDKNGNGALSFDEWAVKTIDKFQCADKDRTG